MYSTASGYKGLTVPLTNSIPSQGVVFDTFALSPFPAPLIAATVMTYGVWGCSPRHSWERREEGRVTTAPLEQDTCCEVDEFDINTRVSQYYRHCSTILVSTTAIMAHESKVHWSISLV